MLIILPQNAVQPASRKIVAAGYAPSALDDAGADEEDIGSEHPLKAVKLEKALSSLYGENSAPRTERGIYFAGRKPTCGIIGLGRINPNRLDKMIIASAENIAHIGKLVRETEQPYGLFVIDAVPYDAFLAVHTIMKEISGKGAYYQQRPVVSVVEKGAEGLVSKLTGQFSGTPLRFVEAKKYGRDVIDAQLLGQPRY